MKFIYLPECIDYECLKENLSQEALEYIETGIQLYINEKIDLIVPRDENNEIIDYADIDVVNQFGEHSEYAIAVKWYEGYEDTGYLIDCLR